MNEIQVVTSFSPRGLAVYGKRFVDSFLEFWPKDVSLWVGVEGQWPNIGHGDKRLHFFDLDADEDLTTFLTYTRKNYGEDSVADYQRQPMKFARKVFALTTPHLYERHAHGAKWWVWIDADVVTEKVVTHRWLDGVFQSDRSVVYLGRPTRKHSETGFMGFNLQNDGLKVLMGMRQYYVVANRPRVFNLEQWHDSMVFDAVMKEQQPKGAVSLSRGPESHVWPNSVLGEVMSHHKGPNRKQRSYGRPA